MNLLERIKSDLRESLLRKEAEKVSILRIVLASVKNLEIDKGKSLTDSELISILKSEIKKIKDSISEFSKAEREDLVKKEAKDLVILEQYLPKQMTEKEIRKAVEEVIKKIPAEKKDFGRVMNIIMKDYKDSVDGAIVSNIVGKMLSKDGIGRN